MRWGNVGLTILSSRSRKNWGMRQACYHAQRLIRVTCTETAKVDCFGGRAVGHQQIDKILEKVTFVTHYVIYWITKGTFMPTPTTPPSAVRRSLRKLGQDIADARKRRGLTMETVADRAFTSRKTLSRIEDGDHGVSIGIYASVLNALGLLGGLGELADPASDELGLSLSSAELPKRIRPKRK